MMASYFFSIRQGARKKVTLSDAFSVLRLYLMVRIVNCTLLLMVGEAVGRCTPSQ